LGVGSRKSEVGSWKLEVGSWKSEVGSQKSEVRSRKSEVGSWKLEVGSQKSGVGSLDGDRKLGVGPALRGEQWAVVVCGCDTRLWKRLRLMVEVD
jgi:hypothetical protein